MRIIALGWMLLAASPAAADDAPSFVPQFVGAWDKTQNLICDVGAGEALSRQGLASAVLDSLSYGRDASDRGKEIKDAVAGVSDTTSVMTELLRISKTSSNDYRCAEQIIAPFNQIESNATMRMIAQSILFAWHDHILINDRLDMLTKKLGSVGAADMADQMSTMQVDRDKAWHSLLPPVEFMLLGLQEGSNADAEGRVNRLKMSLVEKRILREKVVRLFPLSVSDDSRNLDMPNFIASLYITLLSRFRARDEQ